MKESTIMQHLEEVAEKLNIKVQPVSLRKYAYGMKSGLCKVNGEHRIIMDKHLQMIEIRLCLKQLHDLCQAL